MNAATVVRHPQFILAAQSKYFETLQCDGSKVFTQGLTNYDQFKMFADIQMHLIVGQRSMLELNPTYRQLLPYVIVRQRSFDGQYVYFTYRRTSGVGESRLAGNVSIGYGGHIDLEDVVFKCRGGSVIDLHLTVWYSAIREINEEIILKSGIAPILIGNADLNYANQFILDDTNEVGKVHLGIIMVLNIPSDEIVLCKEDELTTMPPMTAKELLESGLPLENWTKIYLESVVALPPKQLLAV